MNKLTLIFSFYLTLGFLPGNCVYAVEKKPEILPSKAEIKEQQRKAVAEEAKIFEPQPVQDIAYGSVLFQHFQDYDFNSLTEILIARKRELIFYHDEEIDALQGRLYFRYGLLNRAEQLLNDLLQRPILSQTRAEVFYLLAQARYQVGDFQQAASYLSQSSTEKNHQFIDDRHLLGANLAMRKQDFESAAKQLASISKDSPLAGYSYYNHGIALLSLEEYDDAQYMFEKVFHLAAFSEVSKSIVDKTALALGYFHLQRNNSEEARRLLLSVRTKGPFVSKALLGLGWSHLNDKDFERALVPWLRLIEMDKRDSAVQEALIAVPYAYQQLGAMQEALDGYVNAAAIFAQEYAHISSIVQGVNEGKLVPILEKVAEPKKGFLKQRWDNQEIDITSSPENFYLSEMFSDYEFHNTFREYQDIKHLRALLTHWEEQIPIFLEMMTLNETFYNEKKPLVDTALEDNDEELFEESLGSLRDKFRYASRRNEAEELANSVEKKHIDTVAKLNTFFDKIPPDQMNAELAEKKLKLRFLQGYLYWQLQTNFLSRQWTAKKSLQQAESAMAELRSQKQRLVESHQFAQSRFQGFDGQLLGYSQRLDKLKQAIFILEQKYETLLNKMAISELKERQQILSQYQLQTDLAIARLHDKRLRVIEQKTDTTEAVPTVSSDEPVMPQEQQPGEEQ
ncbi:MAG: tetratricopeptide repeat protein [Pseudomonadota bacterium]